MKQRVYIIILHFGLLETTKNCIQSLFKYERKFEKIVIVNNNEDILSAKDFGSTELFMINNRKNLGFAAGVNVGIKYALSQKATHIYLLNNDTSITSATIPSLLKIFEDKKNAGIVAPAISFKKNKRKLYDLGGRLDKLLGRATHKEVPRVDKQVPLDAEYVSGCAILINSQLVKKIGYFDEQFFLYYEDVDFCLRAKKAGFEIYVNPSAIIEHALSKSAGKGSSFAVYHQTRSALQFGEKYSQKWYQKIVNKLFIVFQTIKIVSNNPRGGIGGIRALMEWSYFSQLIYFLFLLGIAFINFWQVLSFSFWKDDWSLYWSSLYDLRGFHGYFNHPGTPVEFFFLSHIFGLHFSLWQFFGILLRAIDAYVVSLMVGYITKSKKSGMLAGVFFAVSYAGMESIHFISGQVTALVLIPLLITVYYFLKSLREKIQYLYNFFFWLCISLIVDPPRVVPIIFLLPLLVIYGIQDRNYQKFAIFLKKFYLGFIFVGIPLFILWFVYLSPGTIFGQALQMFLQRPVLILSKWYELHHFAAAMGNLFVGIVYRMGQDDQNTGMYARQFAVIGYGVFTIMLGSFVLFVRKKSQTFGIVALFIFWSFLFYIPNWLSEPRAPMASPHRYLLISSVGFVGLVAYCIAKTKTKLIVGCLSVLFVFLNMYMTHTVLNYQSVYRANWVTQKVWDTINADVSKEHNDNMIWMFYGKDPWIQQDILLNGSAPFAIARRLRDSDIFPMMTSDNVIAVKFLCNDNLPQINRWNVVVQSKRITLSHVYAWEVEKNGKLINMSDTKRNELEGIAVQQECSVVN